MRFVSLRRALAALRRAGALTSALTGTALSGMPIFTQKPWDRLVDRHPWVGGLSMTLLLGAPLVATLVLDPALYLVGLSLGMLLALALCVALETLPPRVFVGRDGVWVASLSRRRFIGYDRVERVACDDSSVILALVGATVVTLPIASSESGTGDVELSTFGPNECRVRREALVEQIEGALTRFRDAGGAVTNARLLARGSRSIAEWGTALARVRAYRDQWFSAEDLLGIVENPQTAVDQRLGAVLALAGLPEQGSPRREHRVRLSEAIASNANRRVRIALEQAAAGTLDEAAYEAALEAEAKAHAAISPSRVT